MLKNRFEDGTFSIATATPQDPTSLDHHIPALSLQNSIDYLVRTQNLPLKIELKLMEKQLQITCGHQPKTIAFDVPDNDWRQLESHGARQEIQSDQLKIQIPFAQNTSTP